MVRGWFVGHFSPTIYDTKGFEVGFRIHKQGETDNHYHEFTTEVNLLVSGAMILQNKELNAGDIFVLKPFEITNPCFLTDCAIICVKIPSVSTDKVKI